MAETRTCTFDNPATMARECWQNGRLVAAYKMALMLSNKWPPPTRHFFFGANVGPWNKGQMIGDPEAMNG